MKNLSKIFAVLLAISALSSCASVSIEQMKKETADYKLPHLPPENKATVYVVRPDSLGTLVRFNVFLDNKEESSEMGHNRGSQYIYFNVDPGQHTILSKAENWADIIIDAKSGETVFLQQTATMGFIMARNNLNLLDSDHGKYYVKTSSLGTIKKTEK